MIRPTSLRLSVAPLAKRIVLLALAGSLACSGLIPCVAQTSASLAPNFVSPPNDTRPWVYWFWVSGNVSKQGITADLEAMKRAGIGGVLIMCVSFGTPEGIVFGGPEWRDFFKFSCQEANRLGLKINMTNTGGWCGSGGPWITPAQSMQRMVWTDTIVPGGQAFSGVLAQPGIIAGYYEDIAVLAMPLPAIEQRKMSDFSPTASSSTNDPQVQNLIGGDSSSGIQLATPHRQIVIQKALYGDLDNPAQTRDVTKAVQALVDQGKADIPVDQIYSGPDPAPGFLKTLSIEYTADNQPLKASAQDNDVATLLPVWVQVAFPKPFVAQAVTLTMGQAADTWRGKFQTSDDGKTFKSMGVLDPQHPTLNFPPTTSRYFRVVLSGGNPPNGSTLKVAKLDLASARQPDDTIPDIDAKSFYTRKLLPPQPATFPEAPAGAAIAPSSIVDLTSKMDKEGKLTWTPPAGKWLVIRFGHTSTGVENHPAGPGALGLESDKLSASATEAVYGGLMKKLVGDIGPLAGKTLVTTHIDSWETGAQNWTPGFREQFQKLRGYDPQPYWPVMTGRIVESPEVSERFLWDLRRTASDLLAQNYSGKMQELAQKDGLKLSIEGYDAPCDEIQYASKCDEPMGEFWSAGWGGLAYSCTEMVSTGHVYGKRIIGAESFTAASDKWEFYPGNIKTLGDWALCEGINRFVFHRYAMQPWLNRRPGMTMGPFGLYYERTEPWWDESRPWHDYLARCQYLLRQGLFVADVCYLEAENNIQFHSPVTSPNNPPDRPGYNYDGCNADVVLNRMSVKDGRIVLPDGMSYRILVLPEAETMTPALLKKISQLVQAGATVVGPRPKKSPSLERYPQCDSTVAELAGQMWGDCDGKTVTEHSFGAGKVFWGVAPEKVLADDLSLPKDFVAGSGVQGSLRYTHRRLDDGTDIYFVANKDLKAVSGLCTFRVKGRQPAFWWPESGKMEQVATYEQKQGVTDVHVHLEAAESVFVIFPPGAPALDPIVSISRDGETENNKIVVQKAIYGVQGDPARTRDYTARVQALADQGQFSFSVAGIAAGEDPALNTAKTLAVDYTVDGQTKTATGGDGDSITLKLTPSNVVVQSAGYGIPGDPSKTRDVKAAVQAILDGGQDTFAVGSVPIAGGDPAPGLPKTLEINYTADGASGLAVAGDYDTVNIEGTDSEIGRRTSVHIKPDGRWELQAWRKGQYALKTAAGKTFNCEAKDIPAPQAISGAWDLTFPPNEGAPEKFSLDHLEPWNETDNSGVRYFSGTATYRKTFTIDSAVNPGKTRVDLNLGEVKVIADVKLNGKEMGILWRYPYRVEVTDALKPGENTLEIKLTNLMINRMIGDEQLPPDSDRNPDGTLKSWPQWLLDGKPSPTGRYTFVTTPWWTKDSPLQESGLIGPVSLQYAERIALQK